MNTRQDIIQELTEAGIALPGGPVAVPYAVPAGYFAAFAASVLEKIRRESVKAELEQLSPLLAALPKNNPYAVPAGYFGTVPMPEETYPLLAAAPRSTPYTVPAGYFDSFADDLLNRVAPKAKVVQMRPVRWMRMAAAAVVAGALAVGGWLYSNKGTTVAADPQAWVAQHLNNVPDRALDEFIQTADPVQERQQVAATDRAKTEVRQLMSDVSVGEMDAFLEQVPADDNLQTFN